MSDIEFNKRGAITALKRGVFSFVLLAGLAYLMAMAGLAVLFGTANMTLPAVSLAFLAGLCISIIGYGYIIEWSYENVNGHTKVRVGNLDVSKRGLLTALKRGAVAMGIWIIYAMFWFAMIHIPVSNPVTDILNNAFSYGSPVVWLTVLVNLVVSGYIVEFTYENLG
jgi:hypothetical protein